MKVLYSFLIFFFVVTTLFAKKTVVSYDKDLLAYDSFSGEEYGWSGNWNKLYSYGNHYGVGNYWKNGSGNSCCSNSWYYSNRFWYYYDNTNQPDFEYSKGEVELKYSHSSGISINGGDECVKAINTAEGSQSSALSRHIKHHRELENTFYVSFLAQFSETPEQGWDYIAVGSKRFGLDAGVALGSIYYENKMGAAFGRDGRVRNFVNEELPQANKTYFIVGKFFTNKYGVVDKIKIFINPTSLTEESATWQAKAKGDVFISKMLSLDLQAYFHGVAYFDEVRVGSSWEAVVSSIDNGDGSSVTEVNVTKFKGPTGYWKEKEKWSNGLPTEDTDTVIIEGQCAVDEEVNAKDIIVEGTGKLHVVSGGKINTNKPIVLKADKEVAAEFEQEDVTESNVVEKEEYFPGGQWNFVCAPAAMTADDLFPDLKLATSWDDDQADYWLLDYSQEQRAAKGDGMLDIHDGDFMLTEGRGYIVWLDEDKVRTFQYTTVKNELYVSTTNSTTTMLSLNHAGWNLVGNPFAHSVSYEDVFDNCPDNQKYFTGAVYVWDGEGYKVWSKGVGDQEAREIEPMEAFFVKRTSDDPAAAMFCMTDNGSQAAVEQSVSSKSSVVDDVPNSLAVSVNLMKGDLSDYTYIKIDNRASLGLDEELDGLKLNTSSAYNDFIYTTDEKDVFAVNSVALNGDYVEVPLVVNLAQGMDSILLGFSLEGDNDYSFALVDEDEMTIVPVQHGDLLKIQSGYESLIDGRFSIFVTRATNNETALVDVDALDNRLGHIYANDQSIVVESLISEELYLSIIGINGEIYKSVVLDANATVTNLMDAGIYLVRLSNGNETAVQKVLVQ